MSYCGVLSVVFKASETYTPQLTIRLDNSVSENTRAMYASACRSFETWAKAWGALTIRASPPLIASYISHLVEDRHLAVATVRLHRAVLVAIHKANGYEDPTDDEGVRRVIKGIARDHGRAQTQAKPLTAETLQPSGPQLRGGAPWGREEARIGGAGFLRAGG